jgi:hypothetical protein
MNLGKQQTLHADGKYHHHRHRRRRQRLRPIPPEALGIGYESFDIATPPAQLAAGIHSKATLDPDPGAHTTSRRGIFICLALLLLLIFAFVYDLKWPKHLWLQCTLAWPSIFH